MKKIIEGKVYNTETAECVGGWDNRQYGSFDFNRKNQYRKRTGEFSIHGTGGARTRYAKQTGNNLWGEGEQIIPVAYEEARKWSEEFLNGDEYEKIFGAVDESAERRVVGITLSAYVADTAKRAAQKNGLSFSAYIEGLIRANLE